MWILFSLLSAFTDATRNIVAKKTLSGEIDEYVVSWSRNFFALLVLVPLLLLEGIPEIGEWFWTALVISAVTNVIATVLAFRAVKISEVSLITPLFSFSPVFVFLTAPFIIGEIPSLFGAAGVLFVVVGAYIINIEKVKENWYKPILHVFTDKGQRLVLLATLIWAIPSNFSKIGLQASSTIFFVTTLHIGMTLLLTPTLFRKGTRKVFSSGKNIAALGAIGVFGGLASLFQWIAASMAMVAYVLALKHLGGVMTVIAGYLFFKEKDFKNRFAGIIIMIAGTLVLIFLA